MCLGFFILKISEIFQNVLLCEIFKYLLLIRNYTESQKLYIAYVLEMVVSDYQLLAFVIAQSKDNSDNYTAI